MRSSAETVPSLCVFLGGVEAQKLSTSPESMRVLKHVLTCMFCRLCDWHVEEGRAGETEGLG